MAFCLPKEFANKFTQALKDGTINPEKLAGMTSEERNSFFSDIVGKEHATEVNALFESKLLLKDYKTGLVSWAKKVAGMSEAVRKDLISRIEKMDRILNPTEEKAFLSDLVAQKLGANVTIDEAKKIAEMSKKVQELGQNVTDQKSRTAWGYAMLDMQDYLDSLLPKDKNIVANVANIPKTVMSTLDFSAALRQGWGMMSRPQFYKAFGAMFKYAFSEKAYREMQAYIVSHPKYQMAKASGLRISALANKLSGREEAYMTTLLDKIPGIRGSERAYAGFLTKLRFDTFVDLTKSAEIGGESIGNGTRATKDIANVINDFTGSGNIGTGDKYANAVPLLNASLFSPRKISATLNMLNPVRYLDPSVSKTARLAALRQIIGSVTMTAGIITLAGLMGGSTETDATSADFGKAKFGKTRYDFTGGNGTYAVLLARLFKNQTKSSTSGKVTTLGKGYKPTTRADLITQSTRNKLSPIASFIADWLYGSDSMGNPFKASTEILNRAYPLVIQDIQTVLKSDPNNLIPSIFAAEFGVGVQTY